MNSNNIEKRHKNCLTVRDNSGNEYTVTKLLGSGAFGTVYLSCKNQNNCKFVSKFIKIGSATKYALRNVDPKIKNEEYLKAVMSVKKEIEIQKIASVLGIAPDIQAEFICENYYIFVMDLLHDFKTWTKFKEEYKNNTDIIKQTKEKIANTIRLMNSNGIQHYDLHGDNIIIKKDGNITIIDYGLAEITTDPSKQNDEAQQFLDGFYEMPDFVSSRKKQSYSKQQSLNRPTDDDLTVSESSINSFTPSPPQVYIQSPTLSSPMEISPMEFSPF